MLSIEDTILHHIKASGPCATDSIVAYLDEQCTDPAWDGQYNEPAAFNHEFQRQSAKRAAVRTEMARLCGEGKASIYSHDPATCWW